MQVFSFPPIETATARVLILGTMPGRMSLAMQQYYAHPRNAFWRIAGSLFGFDAALDYAARAAALKRNNVAVWDVLQSCFRGGSLDADIDTASIVPNEIPQFLVTHPSIERVAFNGAKAAQLFRRHVQPLLAPQRALDYCYLPSTSPAHAGMSFDNKLQAWRKIIEKF